MPGIRSIGWWLPPGRRSAEEIAQDYGIEKSAIDDIGLYTHVVAGEDDHPANMGARATKKALNAANMAVSDIDLLIFVSASKDFPAPWIAAFGVLHELGATTAAGFDLNNRCNGGCDALWIAKSLIENGTYSTVAVCFAERFDYLLGPQRVPESAGDVTLSAGAATAIITADANNNICGYSHVTNPDLSIHDIKIPAAGGSRCPVNESAIRDELHVWRNNIKLHLLPSLKKYMLEAQRDNVREVSRQAGFQEIDFVVAADVSIKDHIDEFDYLEIDREKALPTLPYLGHIGSVDILIQLGIAIKLLAKKATKIKTQRIVVAMSTQMFCNALAISSDNNKPLADAMGDGIDISLWE